MAFLCGGKMTSPSAASAGDSVRWHVYFSGHVQGVGFRATTCQIAVGYAVTGYVRNLSDGRVELVVEGKKPELDEFLGQIREQLAHRISAEMLDELAANGEFEEFGVRS